MDHKAKTIETYDTYPDEFDEKFGRHFELYTKSYADQFLAKLQGKTILDLGSGPGSHAAYFKERGFDVVCLDLSEEMLKKCREKGLKTIKKDIESLDLPDNSYDGIWAYASLLHVPREKVPGVIKNIARMLKPSGHLGLALKKGTGDHIETHDSYPGTERLFTYFTDEQVDELFSPYFSIIERSESNVKGKYTFLMYLMKKITD